MLTTYVEDLQVRPPIGILLLARNGQGQLEPATSTGNNNIVLTPITKGLLLVTANTEYLWNITGAIQIEFSCRTNQDIKYGFEPNVTQGVDYITLLAGQQKSLDFGDRLYNGNIYFSSAVNEVVIELEIWKINDAN